MTLHAILLLAISLGCRSGASTAHPTAEGARAQPQRVVLISLDGASALMLHELQRQGLLDKGGFERFFREGQVAEAMIPVNPTLTSTNHISLATGFPPSRTGIVGNVFHPSGSPFKDEARGFAAPIGTDTLWEAARRQGRRVGVITWPGVDTQGDRRTADWGLVYVNDPDVRSEVVSISRSDWHASPSGPGQPALESYSPVQAAQVTVGKGLKTVQLQVYALDGKDDGKNLYDSVVVAGWPQRLATAPLRAGEWGQVIWVRSPESRGRVSSWLKLVAVKADLSNTRLYFAGSYRTIAYPADFAGSLLTAGLDWPGEPDDGLLTAGWEGKTGIDLETWIEQAERIAAFMASCIRLGASREDWDLLLGYIPVIDEAEHRLLLRDPRQPGFTPMLRDKLAQSRLRIWQAVDAELQRLLAGLDLSRTTVVVVSDHGMMPIHTVVDPQAVLAEAGLLGEKEAEERGHSSRPVARSIAGGGVAHIYFEKAGDEVLANVARRYSEWRIDGEEPVEKVYRRSEAAQIGLDHPNSGDLILFAREGYAFRGLPEGKAFAPTPTYGMHGHLNTHPEVHAIYLAIGAGVKPGSAGTLRSTDVAPRVAAWLRISPPSRTVQTRQK